MPDRSLRGVYPILSMPFDQKGRIDLEDLRAEAPRWPRAATRRSDRSARAGN